MAKIVAQAETVEQVVQKIKQIPTGNETITLVLNAGEARRFKRIMANQARGEHYDGSRTNALAQSVVDALGITDDDIETR